MSSFSTFTILSNKALKFSLYLILFKGISKVFLLNLHITHLYSRYDNFQQIYTVLPEHSYSNVECSLYQQPPENICFSILLYLQLIRCSCRYSVLSTPT